ncbi:hypothetical protein PoB_003873200 [Plakobranchus ocellatus]|uniref:Uncharacterized protein n=1 Tax=Plakobranchus ocellatus TaxID=259542 RepID=A0AAV4AZA0_9GAST|nr:hypothetical protein PoB_003873200 [Plakobranchus ocellatus]
MDIYNFTNFGGLSLSDISNYLSTILLYSAPAASGGVGGTLASESALRSAGTFLSRVRAPLPAPWPDGGPESLRSPYCGLALYKNQSTYSF